MAEIPSRLLRQGREPDPNFLPSERLFRRSRPSALDDDPLFEAVITFPDPSVNREKYSLPEDVILGYPGFRVFTFRVQDIPRSLDEGGRAFTFGVEHVPEDDNYAHSEVRTYCDGERISKKPPKTVRTKFRLQLAKAMQVLELGL